MSELRALTSARGIAAWCVVLYHIRLSIAGLPPAMLAVLGKGYLAVDFFFLLSGFVIWLSWHDRLRSGGVRAVPHFLQKRIARIWPLHLTMLAGALTLALLLAATGRTDPAFPFAELPLHVMLVQNWGLTDALRWNDPAWSISCELAAYLLFPLPAIALDLRRLRTPALVAIAGAILLALHLALRAQPTLGSDIPHTGLIRCLAEFATGTIVAALWLRTPRNGVTVALAVAAAAMLGRWRGLDETLTVPAGFAALLFLLATVRIPLLEGRAIHALGDISYATYLVHFLLWKALRLVAVHDAGAVAPGIVLLYLALVLVASAGLYRLVERPAQRWFNARSFRPALRRARPPAP